MLGISTLESASTPSIPRVMVSTRFISLLLSVRVGGREGHLGAGCFVGAAQGRIVGDRHGKTPGVVKLRDQTDVSDRRGVAEQECSRAWARHFLKSFQTLGNPMAIP